MFLELRSKSKFEKKMKFRQNGVPKIMTNLPMKYAKFEKPDGLLFQNFLGPRQNVRYLDLLSFILVNPGQVLFCGKILHKLKLTNSEGKKT